VLGNLRYGQRRGRSANGDDNGFSLEHAIELLGIGC
jgi:hypothetical protein